MSLELCRAFYMSDVWLSTLDSILFPRTIEYHPLKITLASLGVDSDQK